VRHERARAVVIASLALVLVAGCTSVPSKPARVAVTLEGVRITRFSPLDTRLAVTLAAFNPNSYDLAVSALEATLAVESEPLLTVSLSAPVTLIAGTETRIEVEARTDYLAIATALDRLTRQRDIHYGVTGSATVQGGVVLPFEKRGELPAARWAGPRP